MLSGALVGLRARHPEDVPVLHEALHDDVELWSRTHTQPWRPLTADAADAPFADGHDSGAVEVFSVVTLGDGELSGDAVLWGIDNHSRSAHIGVGLLPAFRGRGLGVDVVRVLVRYAFVTRGLHRLQAETLAHNAAMIRAAEAVGFGHEGTLRRAAWVNGEFVDEVIYGLLADSEGSY
jgi:RimJ/RimL family protein N-acetyltransferase